MNPLTIYALFVGSEIWVVAFLIGRIISARELGAVVEVEAPRLNVVSINSRRGK